MCWWQCRYGEASLTSMELRTVIQSERRLSPARKLWAGLQPSLRRSSFAMLRAAVFRRARDFMVRTSAADYGRLIAVLAISRSLHYFNYVV